MSKNFDELMRLAKAATKGDWVAVGRNVENTSDVLPDICSTIDRPTFMLDSDRQQCADAAYIAAANPKIIIQLINHILALEKIIAGTIKQGGTL